MLAGEKQGPCQVWGGAQKLSKEFSPEKEPTKTFIATHDVHTLGVLERLVRRSHTLVKIKASEMNSLVVPTRFQPSHGLEMISFNIVLLSMEIKATGRAERTQGRAYGGVGIFRSPWRKGSSNS